jgi:hypothetical protein
MNTDEQSYKTTIFGILEATAANFAENDQVVTPELATAALEVAVAKYSSEPLLRNPTSCGSGLERMAEERTRERCSAANRRVLVNTFPVSPGLSDGYKPCYRCVS